MARQPKVCIGRGWLGGYGGHEDDIRPAAPLPDFIDRSKVPFRAGDGYCSKCRASGVRRARWEGRQAKLVGRERSGAQ